MRMFVDTADPAEIEEWEEHPWVSGFTTNPSLVCAAGSDVSELAKLTEKCISIDGGPEVWDLGDHVWRKIVTPQSHYGNHRVNLTAICSVGQVPESLPSTSDIISVFAGRIMDTGRNPGAVIEAAQDTGAQVLWASVREPYNIVQAEDCGCDIVTVPPAILRKWLDWQGKPLELVAAETIAQFEADR